MSSKYKEAVDNPINEGTKTCYKCSETKSVTEFPKHKQMSDGRLNLCKICHRKASAERRAKNPDYMKEWHAEHKDQQKEYYDKNRKHYQEYHRNYVKNRKNNDPAYKLRATLRLSFYNAIRGFSKAKSVMDLLDCSVEELMNHLESKFQEGMTWDNHGKWHIDHIKPLSAFENPEDPAAWCRANLQPMWAKENMSKGGMNRQIVRDIYGNKIHPPKKKLPEPD